MQHQEFSHSVLMRRLTFKQLSSLVLGIGIIDAAPVVRRPFVLWGLELRRPITGSAVEIHQCMSGRQFAFRGGRYRITTDDALMSVPHEHQDTAAVLAALDSVTACFVTSRTKHFTALLTVRDSVVTHISIFWPDTAGRPTFAGVVAELSRTYGAPAINEHDVAVWKADNGDLYVTSRGMFLESVAVTLADRAACEWFEGLVHQRTPRRRYLDARAARC
jgi:hypothetical protein